MSKTRKVIEVGATKFRGIVGEKTSAVKIIEDSGSLLMRIDIFGKGTYQVRVRVLAENPKRAWLSIFPGKSMPKGKKIISMEEIKTDRLVKAGAFDDSNDAINFIGAR